MWTLRAALLCVACNAAPRPPVGTPIAVAPAPRVIEAPPSECLRDADCKEKPRPNSTAAVCEAGRCDAWDINKLRAWAIAQGVELPAPVELPSLTDVQWIDKTKPNTLYADGALFWPEAKKCVAIKMRWQEPTLIGNVAADYGANPAANGAVVYTLSLGASVILSGPGSMTKHADGTESAWGIGEARQLGHHLAPPFEGALRYHGVRMQKDVTCPAANLQADPRCVPCLRCTKYVVGEGSIEAFSGGHLTKLAKKDPPAGDPVCVACPPDQGMSDKLARFNWLVGPLVRVEVPKDRAEPGFFRKLTDCETDRKTKASTM